ncbi:unnamed protein product [Rotaria socialis]|uniref:TMEM205-like domain-containing protein n=1 Tax=Rotaria socialis TaxID=392032 RepID=A0A821KBB3_9BILA|nr:unnamed protein product [Rotaria socialis]CAF3423762.1 unnamed protein product [Rotaria socialis]CAF3428740.1 unnamed protein product [Rotaria socialis]CAF3446985.1 unnamed protein product [Rotaria socialis]CAF3588339.1 unnamed protein product [Rotaria socialis]
MLAKLLSSSAPYHLLSYASVTGITLWHSFIGGPVAFKTLPRQQFGLLQSKLFPIYFSLQTVLNGICLLTTSNRNGRIIFIIGLVCGLLNLAIVGPWTTKIMNERHKVEKEEGKQYNEPGISDRLKALNKRFGMAHGCSSIINVAIVLSLLAYPFVSSEIKF